MAYAAVISLKQTIQRLLNSSQISVASSSREVIEFAYNEVTSLQEVLKRLDDCSSSSSKRLDALDGQIREAVHKLEDVLEFHESNQFLSESESRGGEEVRQEINSFAETVKKMKEEYIKELDNPLPEEEDDDAVLSSIDFGVKMVGLSDDFTKIKSELLKGMRPLDYGVFSVVGMPGSGRTVIAKIIFEDLYIGQEQSLDCGAWVTIGPKYQFKEILLSILAQINGPVDNDKILSEGDEKLGEYLHTCLKGRRYMIVLDDIWDTQIWDYLRSSFPEQNNGSLVLLTTRLKEVAQYAHCFYSCEMMSFQEHLTWNLVCLGVFGVEPISPEVEEAGMKIAKNCKGGVISVAKVILFLSKAEKTLENWNMIAADKENPIFMVADEISEICKIKEELQLCNSFPDDDKRSFTNQMVSGILELSSLAEAIKMQIFPKRLFSGMEIFSFLGMAGIGKTKLVKEIFEDPSILSGFDHRAWVTLGPKYQAEEILVDILAQIYPDIGKIHLKGDAKVAKDLCTQLSNKRCLIVLDDTWNKEALHYLEKLFPDIKSKVLVTTRLVKVAQFGKFDKIYEMRLLNKEESWCLLRQKVFAEELCPLELEKAGKRISENCEGLPLLILMVADLLSKAERTPEYWNKAAEKENSVFMNAHNEMSKALLPSYKSLPQHLKACFLYMGVFAQNSEISCSKIIKLLIAEGFLEPNPSQTVDDFVAKCLTELVHRTLVMVCQKSSYFRVKTCGLHSVFWHLSNSEAVKNKFFHALNSYADNSIEDTKSQRRLCIRNNILLGIKDVHNSMASISTARSLLCIGQLHQYPVPIYFGLRLLRVLDALKIRFYEFPIEVLKLVQLRYLALTYNGRLPSSISKLWNLQCLIVSRHLNIKSSGDSSYLPVEIWDMKELKHLQVMGSSLPNPNCGALLPNLLTLLDVSAHSCTKRVLKGIPNLRRLGIQIELEPNDDIKPFRCLNRISRLRRLKSLKCVVINPELGSEVVAPPAPLSMFPSGLKKLSLSGLGYPWGYMSIIGKLRNLEVLKLRCYAFRGPEWETDYFNFWKLRYFSIEDTNLVRWKLKMPTFLDLKRLSIKHCYKLEELPCHLPTFGQMIEVVDCNTLAVTWAKQREKKDLHNLLTLETSEIRVHSSWDAENLRQ